MTENKKVNLLDEIYPLETSSETPTGVGDCRGVSEPLEEVVALNEIVARYPVTVSGDNLLDQGDFQERGITITSSDILDEEWVQPSVIADFSHVSSFTEDGVKIISIGGGGNHPPSEGIIGNEHIGFPENVEFPEIQNLGNDTGLYQSRKERRRALKDLPRKERKELARQKREVYSTANVKRGIFPRQFGKSWLGADFDDQYVPDQESEPNTKD